MSKLARELEIVVHRDDDYEPGADVWGREIWVAESLNDEDNYLTALHEIGHIANAILGDVLLREWAAWEWAYAIALPVSDEALVRTWEDGFWTYYEDEEEADPWEMLGK